MTKVTFQTVYRLWKSSSDQWELEEVDDYFESCCSDLESVGNIDFDVYVDQFDLKKRFIEEFGKEGYIHYYSEFTIHGFHSCTMDGTEYDEEYEIIDDNVRWLGEDWNKESFEYNDEMKRNKEKRISLLVEDLNNLLKNTSSIMQANRTNYSDILHYLLENHPNILKNKLPEIYNNIQICINLETVEQDKFWNNFFK